MKKLLILFAVVSLIFSSCKKDDVQEFKVSIEGTVIDANTYIPLDSATVELYSNGKIKTVSTDKDGHFKLGSFTVGSYPVVFHKTGYLAVEYTYTTNSYMTGSYIIVMGPATNSNQIINKTISLYPLKGELTASVFTVYQNAEPLAAANKPFTINLGAHNEPITGTTDVNGAIHAQGLPTSSSNYFTISFNFTENGVLYKEDISANISTDHINVHGYMPNVALGLVSSNILNKFGVSVDTFNISSSIVIVFNQPVDTLPAKSSISLNSYLGSTKLTWSNNNLKATLKPATNLNSNTNYSVYINAYDISDTKNYNKTLNFKTKK